MEPQQHHHQQTENEEHNNNNSITSITNEKTTTNGSNNNYMCRQSSTRWTPTTDQIRILKELYYNNGVRSPTAEQIQRISARLRQYGKIEGKNVFYWFQNHKARERQKKRFISDHHHHNNFLVTSVSSTLQRSSASTFNNKSHDDFSNTISTPHQLHNNFSDLSPQGVANPCSSSSATGVFTVGQMGTFGYGGGSVNVETIFRDCSLSTGVACVNGNINQNFGLVGVDPFASSNIYNEKRDSNYIMETLEEEQDEDEDYNYQPQQVHEIETLPLFPMHNEDHNMINSHFCNSKPQSDGYYTSGCCRSSDNGYGYGGGTRSRTSLELSLSYSARSHDST